MSEAAVLDLGLARLVQIEQRIGGAESEGLRARWEFGHELLRARDGKGRLPNGYRARVVEQTGASVAELTYRMQFAERFSSREELFNAVEQFRSWHEVVNAVLPEKEQSAGVRATPDLPAGTYQTIVSDPPWKYGNERWGVGAVGPEYATMEFEEIVALPVKERAAPNAHLYLWVTNAKLLDHNYGALVNAWGFTYKTLLTWRKTACLGIGHYFRGETEHVLFAVRGTLPISAALRQRNWFEAPRGRHSEKPGSFFDLVERVSPGPYLEMFARQRRLNPEWDYWGDEA